MYFPGRRQPPSTCRNTSEILTIIFQRCTYSHLQQHVVALNYPTTSSLLPFLTSNVHPCPPDIIHYCPGGQPLEASSPCSLTRYPLVPPTPVVRLREGRWQFYAVLVSFVVGCVPFSTWVGRERSSASEQRIGQCSTWTARKFVSCLLCKIWKISSW